jgi:hypothetical protein
MNVFLRLRLDLASTLVNIWLNPTSVVSTVADYVYSKAQYGYAATVWHLPISSSYLHRNICSFRIFRNHLYFCKWWSPSLLVSTWNLGLWMSIRTCLSGRTFSVHIYDLGKGSGNSRVVLSILKRYRPLSCKNSLPERERWRLKRCWRGKTCT